MPYPRQRSKNLAYQADFENERRWLSFDLLCGAVDRSHVLWGYLTDNQISAEELDYFCEHACPPDILGVNYYLTSERYLDDAIDTYPSHTHGGNGRHVYADVEAVRVANIEPDGLQKLLKEAWNRYAIRIAVTEVHLHCTREEQMRWLNETWNAANDLGVQGVPIVAITPWALLGSYGWDKLLTAPGGTYEPGIFDCRTGHVRPTILAAMIRSFGRNFSFRHPALEQPGWWHRDCRVTYGQARRRLDINDALTIAISGDHAEAVRRICTQRCFNVVDTVAAVLSDIPMWATINARDPMQLRCAGQPALYIALSGNLIQDVHTALDLLLDGESGYWRQNENGTLVKEISNYSPTLHCLAS